MTYSIEYGYFKSTNGKSDIHYYTYVPQGEIKGIIQISHGMCEYFERYDEVACYMVEKGFVVCGNDHIGHGKSVCSKDEYGYFGDKNGYKYLVNDVKKLTEIIKLKYKNIPIFLLGHSFGSFIVRTYITKYGNDLNGVLISGTSGGSRLNKTAVLTTELIKRIKGSKYRSSVVNNIAFGNYNKKYKEKYSKHDWLTRDKKIIDNFENDDRKNFIFTTSGFNDMFYLLHFVSSKQWADLVPKDLPILMFSGDMDPVGDYGKGVIKVYKRLKSANVNDVTLNLYPEGRHEMLNEINRNEVFEDIYKWIEQRINNIDEVKHE